MWRRRWGSIRGEISVAGGSAGMLIGFDASLGDAVPIKMRLDQSAAGLAHFPGELGVRSDLQYGAGEFARIEGQHKSGIRFGNLGEMAGIGDDHRRARGDGFGDGDAEAFLAAGETEAGAIDESGEFVWAIEGADEVDAFYHAG